MSREGDRALTFSPARAVFFCEGEALWTPTKFDGLSRRGFIFRGSIQHAWKCDNIAVTKLEGEIIAMRVEQVLVTTKLFSF